MAVCAGCGRLVPDGVACTSCVGTVAPRPPIAVNPPPPQRLPVVLPPPRPWREQLSSDPTENALLLAIRENPDDDQARLVYGDWLIQRGESERAGFVRDDGSVHAVGHPEWREITARAEIASCDRADCVGRWNKLRSDPSDERTRACGACARRVRYCASRHDAEVASTETVPMAVDAGANRDELVGHYQRAKRF